MSTKIQLKQRIRPQFRADINDGVYSNGVVYEVGDRVLYNDTLYECIKTDGTVHTPEESDFWSSVIVKGVIGETPSHTWNGTIVSFVNNDGNTVEVDLQGPKGEDGEFTPISDAIDSDSSEIAGSSKACKNALAAALNRVNNEDFFPVGTVLPFSGSFSGRYPIPIGSTTADTNWVLCDGTTTNGVAVPDLRGRFVVGAGKIDDKELAIGTTGGANKHSHTVSYSSDTAMVSATDGGVAHNHSSSTDTYYGFNTPNLSYYGSTTSSSTTQTSEVFSYEAEYSSKLSDYPHVSTYTGGSQVHNHSITNNGVQTTDEVSNIPPYYALSFIMKIPPKKTPKSINVPYFSSTGTQHTTGIGLNQPSTLNDLVITYDTGEYLAAGDTLLITQTGNGSGRTQLVATGTGGWNIPVNSGWTINGGADKAVITIVSSSVSTFSNGATQIEITIN